MTKHHIATKFILILLTIATACKVQAQSKDDTTTIKAKMTEIRNDLNNLILVNRFQSVETPCFEINDHDSTQAKHSALNGIINNNYRIRLFRDSVITPGIKCLSEFCCRYMRLLVNDSMDVTNLKMSGIVESTYGYPSSTLMQYIGLTYTLQGRDSIYFKKLIRNTGTFEIYPEDSRYKIRLRFPTSPYNSDFIIYGYIEAIRPAQPGDNRVVYNIYFDQLDIKHGDANNRIFVKFSGTSHRDEQLYFQSLITNIINKGQHKNITPGNAKAQSVYDLDKTKPKQDIKSEAYAKWLLNFLKQAPYCDIFYRSAITTQNSQSFQLPNISPTPAK